MAQEIFSINALLGTELLSENGFSIGIVVDVIADKAGGHFEFFLISSGDAIGQNDRLYAIHHSFFRLGKPDEELVFSPQFAQEGKEFAKASLPEHYRVSRVGDYQHFYAEILQDLTFGGHRSDNQLS